MKYVRWSDSLSTQRTWVTPATFRYLFSFRFGYSNRTYKINTFYLLFFFRYECFKQENSISLFPIALLLIFSVSVTVVSIHCHNNRIIYFEPHCKGSIASVTPHLEQFLYLSLQVYLQWKEPVFHQVRACSVLHSPDSDCFLFAIRAQCAFSHFSLV